MATDADRYAALRAFAVRWGYMPSEIIAVMRDTRATGAEFDAAADLAVEHVRKHAPYAMPAGVAPT